MLTVIMQLRRIVLATDFSEGAEAATEAAGSLAAAHHASITLVHVFELPLDFGMCAALVDSGIEVENRLAVAAEVALETVKCRLAAQGIASTTLLRMGPAHQKIHNVAADVGADLIVLGMQGSRGRANVIGSVAERVTRTATRPVLLVPARAAKRLTHG